MKDFKREKEDLLQSLETSQDLLLSRVRTVVKGSSHPDVEDVIEQACEHLRTGEELIYKISQLKERSLAFPEFMTEIAKMFCSNKENEEPKDCGDGTESED